MFGLQKRGPFIRSLNNILHAQDGPLFEYKKVNDNSSKNVSQGLMFLDQFLETSHSDQNGEAGEDGEECPSHLVDVLALYKIVRERKTFAITPNTSAQNLLIQRSIFSE